MTIRLRAAWRNTSVSRASFGSAQPVNTVVLQVMTFEQLAARLAGSLTRPVDDDALREAINTVLQTIGLGELDGIKALPGMVKAAAASDCS